ncbi:MAG: LysR family transcriptional regulator [Burkholderiales bacterium]
MDRLQSMRVFERVVDEGGFAAAARGLDLSPAVVTRLVADLEEHLGTRLLHRSTRRLSLTSAGEGYLARVRAILHEVDDAEGQARAQTHEMSGVLRLLSPPGLAMRLLAPLVASFREKHPKVRLVIDVATHEEPPIEDHDITLLAADGSFNADIIARTILSTNIVLVAAPAYVQRCGPLASPAELGRCHCLHPRASGAPLQTWRLWRADDASGSAGASAVEVEVRPVLACNQPDTLLRAALDGVGVAAAAVGLVAPYLAEGTLQTVLPGWVVGRLTVYAALPSRRFMPERTRAFLDHMVEAAARLDPVTAGIAVPR